MSGTSAQDYAYLADRRRADDERAFGEAEHRRAVLEAQLATPAHDQIDERWLVLVGAATRPPTRAQLGAELAALRSMLAPKVLDVTTGAGWSRWTPDGDQFVTRNDLLDASAVVYPLDGRWWVTVRVGAGWAQGKSDGYTDRGYAVLGAHVTLRKYGLRDAQMPDLRVPRAPEDNRCNRHDDCDAADRANPERAYVHHCHSDYCEDCFGQ